MTQTMPTSPTAGGTLVFEDSIEVPAPINEVYRRWSDFAHFPDFMENVEEVQPRGGNRYHWVARIFGIKQEWDAEVLEDNQRRIAWRSLNGSFNSGAVDFTPISNTLCRVHLRLEYAPPGGKVGQALDQMTQTTKREVQEDLGNFRRIFYGQGGTLPQQTMQTLQAQTPGGMGGVMGPLIIPITASVAGGIASYLIGRRLRESRAYAVATSPVARPHAVAGWLFTAASGASILGAASLRAQGRTTDALFVGQWAPTLLEFGIFSRLLGHRGVQTNLPTSVTSWAYVSASIGSMLASAWMHLRGKREDGLFIGQWAPTFLGAALFSRLFNRMLSR